MRSRSAGVSPAFAQATLIALAGWSWMLVSSGPATMPLARISAIHGRPAASAASLSMMTSAAAPSEIEEALPAVMVPSVGRRPAARRDLDRRVGTHPFVTLHHDRVAPTLRDGHGHDLVGEHPRVPGRGGALM